MKLEFSLREIKKMIKQYYLKKEGYRVKVELDVDIYYYNNRSKSYSFSGTIIFRKKINGFLSEVKININEDLIFQILNHYLTSEDYITDNIYPLMEKNYRDCEQLIGVKVFCHKTEKEQNKKLVRKQ